MYNDEKVEDKRNELKKSLNFTEYEQYYNYNYNYNYDGNEKSDE
jgi:hypothetical protein